MHKEIRLILKCVCVCLRGREGERETKVKDPRELIEKLLS